jgi:hypothetical protein
MNEILPVLEKAYQRGVHDTEQRLANRLNAAMVLIGAFMCPMTPSKDGYTLAMMTGPELFDTYEAMAAFRTQYLTECMDTFMSDEKMRPSE